MNMVNNDWPDSAWICTDPSQGQYCRKVDAFQYELKDDATEPVIIDLNEYLHTQVQNIIQSYGYTLGASTRYLANIHDEYGIDAGQIIAECIFESEFSHFQR